MARKIIIVGGGVGGYVAAIRASQMDAEVILIEKDNLGGTCLNRGCIPTKALLQSVDILERTRCAETFGISAEKISVDFSVVFRRKTAVVKRMLDGVTYLMKKNKIRVIRDTATLVDSRTVGLSGKNEKIKADNIIIATGSEASTIPILGIHQNELLTSNEILAMEQLPENVVIIGGGVIGLEFAEIMHKLGSEVTIIEMMPQILPTGDKEVAKTFKNILKKEGIEIFTDALVTGIEREKSGGEKVTFTTKGDNSEKYKISEKVLLAVGRHPYTDGLGIDTLGLATDGGRIIVNKRMETNIPGVYAVGDVIGGVMLAHVAMEEGKCAVENIMGVDAGINYRATPCCVYTSPEIAWVGLTENEAKEKYGDIRVGRAPFTAIGKAQILNEMTGMVKIIADGNYGEILGVHIIGPNATELIAAAVLGIKMEATFEDIATTIHAHPTLSEAVMEAALDVGGKSINF